MKPPRSPCGVCGEERAPFLVGYWVDDTATSDGPRGMIAVEARVRRADVCSEACARRFREWAKKSGRAAHIKRAYDVYGRDGAYVDHAIDELNSGDRSGGAHVAPRLELPVCSVGASPKPGGGRMAGDGVKAPANAGRGALTIAGGVDATAVHVGALNGAPASAGTPDPLTRTQGASDSARTWGLHRNIDRGQSLGAPPLTRRDPTAFSR